VPQAWVQSAFEVQQMLAQKFGAGNGLSESHWGTGAAVWAWAGEANFRACGTGQLRRGAGVSAIAATAVTNTRRNVRNTIFVVTFMFDSPEKVLPIIRQAIVFRHSGGSESATKR